MLAPKSIGFIYKQYCQSISKYGFENLTLDKKNLHDLNVRQNILLKHILGIGTDCRTTPLMQSLKVEQMNQIYLKHKLFGIKQFLNNPLSQSTFQFLSLFYQGKPKINKRSFFYQLKDLEEFVNMKVDFDSLRVAQNKLDKLFTSDDSELLERIAYIFNRYENGYIYTASKELESCLSTYR